MKLGAFECEIEFATDVVDCYVAHGYGLNTGVELTPNQCAEITELYMPELYEAWLDHQICRAEDWADRDR